MKTVYKNGREWSKQDIKDLLSRNDKAVKRALLLIYDYQTEEEKSCEETVEDNGIGFSGVDANILSSFARQLKEKEWLSSKQMEIARKKMLKYSGQILRHMEMN